MLDIVILLSISFISIYLVRRNNKRKPQTTDAVFITGCDTGIGYSLAHYCQEIGMTVLAGCLEMGEGACKLEELKNVHVVPLDLRNAASIRKATLRVQNVLINNPDTVLKAVVNNAGIMVFGEFAWQTEEQIREQIQINLVGGMHITQALLPHIIKSQGRIINICSHCSLEALPGLSAYSASKAGLLAWSNALRVELKKFKIPVVTLIPGSFPFQTNILANQGHYASQMQYSMSESDWKQYQTYFKEYNSYLTSFKEPKMLEKINDKHLYKMFDDALRLSKPKSHYCYSNWRYWFYHILFKITPTSTRDYLILKFVNMPKWKKTY